MKDLFQLLFFADLGVFNYSLNPVTILYDLTQNQQKFYLMYDSENQNLKTCLQSSSSANIFVNRNTFYGKLIHIRRGFRKMPKTTGKKDRRESKQQTRTLKPKSKSFCFESNDEPVNQANEAATFSFGQTSQLKTSWLKHSQASSQLRHNIQGKISPSLQKLIVAVVGSKPATKNNSAHKINKYQTQVSLDYRFRTKPLASEDNYFLRLQNPLERQHLQTKQRGRSKTLPMKSLQERLNKQAVSKTIVKQHKIFQQKKDESLRQLFGKKMKSNEKSALIRLKRAFQQPIQQQKGGEEKQVLILQANSSKFQKIERKIRIATNQPKQQIKRVKVHIESQNLMGPWSKQGLMDYQDQQIHI